MCILQKPSSLFDYAVFLSCITFTSIYTEDCGTLDSSDENYDGNYAIKIQGRVEDTTFIGKINGLVFIGGQVNKSSVGDYWYVGGTSNIYITNLDNVTIDWNKNVRPSMIPFRTSSLRIGGAYNTDLKRFNIERNIQTGIVLNKVGDETNILSEQLWDYEIIGNLLFVSCYAKIDESLVINPTDASQVELKISNFVLPGKYKGTRLLGYGRLGSTNIKLGTFSQMDAQTIYIATESLGLFQYKDITPGSALNFVLTAIVND